MRADNGVYNNVSLMVLAGGMGSRFGGLKQLYPLGYKKQTILEYTLDDAEKIGIKKIVFVIRKATEADFREQVLSKLFRRPFEIKLAFQEIEDVPMGFNTPPNRTKPWGTGQALYVGWKALRTAAAVVVNADDYYGANALKAAAEAAQWGRNALVAYPLEQTLSTRGPVSRGLIKRNADGTLAEIEETHKLTHSNAPKGALASMNCIALSASMAKPIEENWLKFCAKDIIATPDAECYLPNALREAMKQGITIEVAPTTDQWLGLTHRDDIPEVDLKIGRQHATQNA